MGRKGFSKKVASYRVVKVSNLIIITKYNKKTHQDDIVKEKRFETERPDIYRRLNSAKRIKKFIKQ